jgi:hypothetical protein
MSLTKAQIISLGLPKHQFLYWPTLSDIAWNFLAVAPRRLVYARVERQVHIRVNSFVDMRVYLEIGLDIEAVAARQKK